MTTKSFAELFKKYRLRAEFDTFSAFSDALSEKGYYYEESIFSHWQKGTRVPNNRQLILKIIEVFIEREAIKTIEEANAFLAATGLGYLTEDERTALSLKQTLQMPFQVPSEIAHFTGREHVIEKVKKDLKKNNVFLFYGPPGVGKTALAIKLGHAVRNMFPDGVLWYKVDSSNLMDILYSIARLYGEDISEIKDIEVRASAVRTLLAHKKVLLIFDNVTKDHKLNLLLPNNASCSVIFSSREIALDTNVQFVPISVQAFTKEEALDLFRNVFDKKYVEKEKAHILELANQLGFLPLALDLVASHSRQSKQSISNVLMQFKEESLDLNTFTYEDKNLFKAIQISFDSLQENTKKVFISLGVFEGKDFSAEAVGSINNLSSKETKRMLEQLTSISLIDLSKTDRYRIHPMIRTFARKKLSDTTVYLRAATYYEQLLTNTQNTQSQKQLMQDVDNIIHIFKKCYEFGYWDQVITLWNPIEKFLSDNNEVKKLLALTNTIDTAPQINSFQKLLSIFMIFILIYWVVLFMTGLKSGFWNNMWGFLWSFLPFIGGFIGICLTKAWGLFRTNIGKAIFFTSAGIFSWGMGNMIWIYYNFFEKVDIPYPSLADLGYILAGILWIIGITYLSIATGAKSNIKHKRKKLLLLLIPISVTTLTYYILLFQLNDGFISKSPSRIFFDLIYPTNDLIILTLAIGIFSLSVNFFSGKYKLSVVTILVGFIGMYIADMTFSYTTSIGIYFNGSIFELLFAYAIFSLTWGTLSFYIPPKRLSK